MARPRFLGALLVALLFCAAACSTHVGRKDVAQLGKRAVIFVPGFKGSALAEERSGDLVWVTPWEALFGDANLALDTFGLPLRGHKTGPLVPTGVLGGLSAAFGLYHYDIYEGWLEALQSISRQERRESGGDLKVIAAPYDWRLGLSETAKDIASLVRTLRAQGVEDISIVAHSMGGLPAAYYLRYGGGAPGDEPEWSGASEVSRVVFAYVPFGGTLAIIRDFRLGVTTGRNDTLLDQVALSSFPSSYHLIPGAEEGVLMDEQGTDISLSLFDPEVWTRYRLGLLNRIADETQRQRLLSLLAQGRRFWTELRAPLDGEVGARVFAGPLPARGAEVEEAQAAISDREQGRCKVLYYVSDSYSTLSRAILSKGELWFGEVDIPELEELRPRMFGPGDGLIPRESMELPAVFKEALEVERREGTARHDLILNDSAAREEIIEFLLSGEQQKPPALARVPPGE